MKTLVKSIFTFSGILLTLSATILTAGNISIKKIDNADLDSLAKSAAASNKNVMIIYYKGTCKACSQLSKNINKSKTLLSQKFVVYKTDVSSGFNVVCPNNDVYTDNEYMDIKGITKLPALVITDTDGNVSFVKNNIIDMKGLVAAVQQFSKNKLALRNKGIQKIVN